MVAHVDRSGIDFTESIGGQLDHLFRTKRPSGRPGSKLRCSHCDPVPFLEVANTVPDIDDLGKTFITPDENVLSCKRSQRRLRRVNALYDINVGRIDGSQAEANVYRAGGRWGDRVIRLYSKDFSGVSVVSVDHSTVSVAS